MSLNKNCFLIVWLIFSNALSAETLEQAWQQALANNHRLKAAQADTRVYDEQLYAAEGLKLPSVNLNTGYTQLSQTPTVKANFNGQSSRFVMAQDGYWKAQALVTLPIYTSGQIEHTINAAESALEAAKQHEVSSELELKMQVAESYIAVLRAEGALTVAEKHLQSLTAHNKDAVNHFNQGLVAKNDVLAASVEVANAQQKVVAIKNQGDLARAHYNQLLSRGLAVPVKLTAKFPSKPDGSLKELTLKALNQRPELVVLSEQINALLQQAESVSSSLLPQLALTGGYQYEENRYQVYQGMWMVNVGMQWKLFDNSTRHKERAIVQQAVSLKEQRDEMASTIRLQVRQAWLDSQETIRRITVAQQAIASANENRDVSVDRYQQGLATNTDLLKAQDLRTLSDENLNNARYDAALAVLHLRYALGIL